MKASIFTIVSIISVIIKKCKSNVTLCTLMNNFINSTNIPNKKEGVSVKFKNMDEIDQQILGLLSQNSRMSYIDIGKSVNLSRVAVKSRIDAMEKEGIIEQYSIIINPQKVGRTVSAFFDIEVEPKCFYQTAAELAAKEQVTDIYQMTGSSKLHVHAVMELNDDLEKFLREEIYVMPGIVSIESNLIVSRIKTRKGIRV